MVVESLISGHVYEVGDMVWAKMKSQPWLPGHVYSEELATPLVRQTKKEGLLLVAFFGASSFAWFDSSQLLPFDANYAEMCRQSYSRLFVKAVEDAVVEVNRRIGLGMSCMCRNKLKFRTIDAHGFVVVDVAGYDSGALYSVDAIGKARDSFQPKLASDFIRQLALEPDSSERVDDIDFIKNKAIVVSYRKTVFVNFDDPYDLASVQEPATPQETSSKAPLSGMKVLDNSLGKHTNTTKRKDHDKKDDYIFKRREEPKKITTEKEKVASSLLPISLKNSASALGEFPLKDATGCLEDTSPSVLEFRNPCFEKSTSVADSAASFVAEVDQAKGKSADDKKRIVQEEDNYDKDLSRVLGDLHSLAVDPCNPVNRRSCSKGKKAFLRFRSLVYQKSKNYSLPMADGEPDATTKSSEDNVEVLPVKSLSGLKRDPSERQKEKVVSKKKRVDDIRKLTSEKNIINNKIDEHPTRTLKKTESGATTLILKFQQGGYLPSFNELKARFARYGPMDHSATKIFRNTLSCQLVFRHRVHAEAAYRFVVGSTSLFGNTDVKCSLKDIGEPERLVKVPEDHHQPAMEDRPPSMVPPATSGVLVKSILKTSTCEEVTGKGGNEVFADSLGKVTNTAKATEHAKKDRYLLKSREESKERKVDKEKATLSSLPVGESGSGKSIMPEDSVQVPPVQPPSELKRGPPDIQKLMTAAKKKKAVVKNLAKEKKVTKMIDEPGPTMLMIKFPRGGYLPSYNELKARFSCFGPMDHSGTHIFWNTFSCQVVFEHNADAQAAYRFVVGSGSLFGNKGVQCTLKVVGTSLDRSEPLVEAPNEDHHQPKPILKKSGGKEAAGNFDKGRVKFMLGGEESQKSGATSISSHLTMNQSTKNFEKVVHRSVVTSVTSSSTTPPPPSMRHDTTLLSPPSLPPVPQHAVQMTNGQLSDPLMTQNVDITQQMLSLLIRCNDVVTNVSTILGYSPYQPL